MTMQSSDSFVPHIPHYPPPSRVPGPETNHSCDRGEDRTARFHHHHQHQHLTTEFVFPQPLEHEAEPLGSLHRHHRRPPKKQSHHRKRHQYQHQHQHQHRLRPPQLRLCFPSEIESFRHYPFQNPNASHPDPSVMPPPPLVRVAARYFLTCPKHRSRFDRHHRGFVLVRAIRDRDRDCHRMTTDIEWGGEAVPVPSRNSGTGTRTRTRTRSRTRTPPGSPFVFQDAFRSNNAAVGMGNKNTDKNKDKNKENKNNKNSNSNTTRISNAKPARSPTHPTFAARSEARNEPNPPPESAAGPLWKPEPAAITTPMDVEAFVPGDGAIILHSHSHSHSHSHGLPPPHGRVDAGDDAVEVGIGNRSAVGDRHPLGVCDSPRCGFGAPQGSSAEAPRRVSDPSEDDGCPCEHNKAE